MRQAHVTLGKAEIPKLEFLNPALDETIKSNYEIVMKQWVVSDPEHLGGSPRVRGTRIPVALILESLAVGMSIADIVDAYPSLTEEAVRGTLAELAHQNELHPA